MMTFAASYVFLRTRLTITVEYGVLLRMLPAYPRILIPPKYHPTPPLLCSAQNQQRAMKNLLLFLLLCLLGHYAIGQTEAANDQVGSPYFQLDVEGVDFPLTATSADVSISGIIADVTVTQTYVNAGSQRLEATYVFPGSTNSAVYAMNMIIGNRRIKGEIQRKAEARATYEKAKKDGKRASLLEQHRPNVFQMNVANILPGDTVRVELKYTELLIPTNGIYSFVYPTVVGPRYVGADASASPEIYTAQPYTPTDLPTYDFDLSVHLNAGMPISSVSSPSHKLSLQRSDEAVAIRLDGSERQGGQSGFRPGIQPSGQPNTDGDAHLRG